MRKGETHHDKHEAELQTFLKGIRTHVGVKLNQYQESALRERLAKNRRRRPCASQD